MGAADTTRDGRELGALLSGSILFILKGYPRLSESFIAQEILELERRGLEIEIASLRRPTDRALHPIHRAIRAPVSYLPEYLHHEPLRTWRAWRRVRRWPSYPQARSAWLADLRRDRTRNRIRRFGQAVVLAHELPRAITRLHAHFLHTPASVARYASLLTGLPWSCSAHAKDIWTTPEWEKREKLASAEWLVTCTAHGQGHLAALAPAPDRVILAYHGLDFARFAAPPAPSNDPRVPSMRDGRDPSAPVVILSVGRLVEKKGYDDLIEALAHLPRERAWRLVHVGSGPLDHALRRRAAALGLAGRIVWRGAQPQDEVLTQYRQADLFVLASRIARDGDRDGLPNVLMEAQSQGLPVVATRVSAIPELVVDGETGLLVGPGDRRALACALDSLISDPARRRALGQAGLHRVRQHFALQAGIDRLVERLAPESGPGRCCA